MSNKSRGRLRPVDDDNAEPDPDAADRAATIEAANEAYVKGDKRAGLDKLVGLILRDRDKALTPINPAAPVTDDQLHKVGPAPRLELVREPTAYEAAVLFALGNRTTVIDGTRGPIHAPINVVSGGVYGGTVEPERIAHRRARNKAARAARKGRVRRVPGRVYRSRFGYHVDVPGINAPMVDA